MGLELFELALETEKVFDLRFTDAELTACGTPRAVIDLVWSKLAVAKPQTCPSQHAFYQVRDALVRVLKVHRRSVRPDTSLRTLFPSEGGWERWESFRKTLDPVQWLSAREGSSFLWMVVAATFVFVGIFCMCLGSPVPCVGVAIAFAASVIAALLSVGSVGRLPSCVENGGSVRDLVPLLQQSASCTSSRLLKKPHQLR